MRSLLNLLTNNKLIVLQAISFLFVSLSFILPSGNMTCLEGVCQLAIGEWHMHDALWHISLAQLGFVSYPLANPFMAGHALTGYNFLLDAIILGLMKLGISPFFAFFKALPITIALMFVYSVIKFSYTRTNNYLHTNLMVFFLFFGSSMSYLATLYQGGTFYYSSLRGFPVISSIYPHNMFLNLQFAFSLSIILWIMILIEQKANWRKTALLALLFIALFGFKFYGGVIALLYVVLSKLSSKVSWTEILSTLVGSIAGVVFFYGVSSGATTPFVFDPFSLTRLMIDDSLLFYNHSLTLARYYLYENIAGFPLRLISIELLCVLLFLIMNFGARLISLIYPTRANMRIWIVIVFSALAPILFVQRGGWYNTMQFLYYGVFLSGILMADVLYKIWRGNKKWGITAILIAITLTIPNSIEQLRYINEDQNIITPSQLRALDILKNQPEGIVHINDPIRRDGLVPALAHKYPYYLDTDQLMVVGADYERRLEYIEKFSGGSIANIPADYFLIHKDEPKHEDALRSLSNRNDFDTLYDSDEIALFRRIGKGVPLSE